MKVRFFRADNKRTRCLGKEEVKALPDACADHLRPIIITALNTGIRKSEILKLKWSEVDLIRTEMYICDRKNGGPAN